MTPSCINKPVVLAALFGWPREQDIEDPSVLDACPAIGDLSLRDQMAAVAGVTGVSPLVEVASIRIWRQRPSSINCSRTRPRSSK